MTLSPERKGNIVPFMFNRQARAVGQFEMWRGWLKPLKRFGREVLALLFGFLKPNAPNDFMTPYVAGPLDSHSRTAGLKDDHVPGIKRHLNLLNVISAYVPAKRDSFRSDRLNLIAGAAQFRDSREPSFQIGNRVQLNSGSDVGLVVNNEDNLITVAWPTGEMDLPAECFHRANS